MFKNLGFRSQLILTICAGVILLALITSLLVSRLSTTTMQDHLIDEGKQLSIAIAEQSKVALLYQSDEIAEEALSGIVKTFDDIVGLQVADQEFSVLYKSGEPIPLRRVQYKGEGVLVKDLEHFWQFIAPVHLSNNDNDQDYIDENKDKSTKSTIGFVSVTLSKQPLVELNHKILLYNSIASLGLALVLVVFLILISARLLQPVQYLARVMLATKKGKKIEQVPLLGPPDIRDMFSAFNEMVNMLGKREQELVAARDKAVELAKLKTQFSATVSHELRTPMNGVIGMLEMLETSQLTGHDREYLNVAKFSAQSLLTLINNILDFSKYEAGKVELDEAPFDVFNLMDEVVLLLGANARGKNVELLYDIPERFPQFIVGDINRIRQIFINLVSNAIKFTEDGSVRISAEALLATEAKSSRVMLKFYITDTGIGIANDKQDEVFKAFSQADGSTTRKFGGTGLGLSICKQLVQVMAGDIGVTSSPGKGSCFWFELMLSKADAADAPKRATFSQPCLQNVLSVVKGKDCQQQMTLFLEKLNLQSRYADATASALQILQQASAKKMAIQLLILDKDAEVDLEIILGKARQFNPKLLVLCYGFFCNDDFNDSTSVSLSKPISLNRFASGLNFLKPLDITPAEEEKSADKNSESLLKTVAGLKVLVVDDNPVNTLVAASMLESFECAVDTATDGVDCIVKLSQHSYDIILMDCSMPKMDGYQATRTIRWMHREDVRDIPIIAASAHSGETEVQKCLNLGMNDYLMKPFNKQTLLEKLSAYSHGASKPRLVQ